MVLVPWPLLREWQEYSIEHMEKSTPNNQLLTEQVPNSSGALTHQHLIELGSSCVEEGNACLSGHSTGQKGLSRARRSNQQHTLGQLSTQIGELVWTLEELDHLLQLLLSLVTSLHIVEFNVNLLGIHFHLVANLNSTASGRFGQFSVR